ncbi:MAG: DUF2497 domain-containing protein [Neomegalonema sp.]
MSDILASIRRTLEADDEALADHIYRRERARKAEIAASEELLQESGDAAAREVDRAVRRLEAFHEASVERHNASSLHMQHGETDAPNEPALRAAKDESTGAVAADAEEDRIWADLDRLLSTAQGAFSKETAHPKRTPRVKPVERHAVETPVAAVEPNAAAIGRDPNPQPQTGDAAQGAVEPPPAASPAKLAAAKAPERPIAKPAPAKSVEKAKEPIALPDSGRRKTVLSRVAAAVKKETVKRLSETPPQKGAPSAEIQALLSGQAPHRQPPARLRRPIEPKGETPSAPEDADALDQAEAQRLEMLDLTSDAALPATDTVLQLTTPIEGEPVHPAQDGVGKRLLNRASEEAAAKAFEALADPDGPAAKAILQRIQRSDDAQSPGRLDMIAADTLKPMLSDWLDENLPNLCTRLVREELSKARKP